MTWQDALAVLPAISLEELDATAAFQTRVDRKYLVAPEVWEQALAELHGLRVLEIDGRRSFRYASVYFDTPQLDSYRAAAHRRPSRYKVRTREYVDTGATAIEVKLRSARGETVKHREFLPERPAGRMLRGAARSFVSSFPEVAPDADRLTATLETAYHRTTLWTPDGRVTVDSDVRGIDADGAVAAFGSALIIETKSAQRAGLADRALWARGIRPQRVSKYCTTLAALRPDLPSNRWTRTLTRHLAGAATS